MGEKRGPAGPSVSLSGHACRAGRSRGLVAPEALEACPAVGLASACANHVAIAALVVDAFGAVLLLKALAFQTAEQYARENPAALYPRSTDLGRDAGRARDVADAQAGALLLFVGFLGQAVGAWQSHWSCATASAAYAVAVVLIATALASRRRLRRRFEGQLYVAHVALEFQDGTARPADAQLRCGTGSISPPTVERRSLTFGRRRPSARSAWIPEPGRPRWRTRRCSATPTAAPAPLGNACRAPRVLALHRAGSGVLLPRGGGTRPGCRPSQASRRVQGAWSEASSRSVRGSTQALRSGHGAQSGEQIERNRDQLNTTQTALRRGTRPHATGSLRLGAGRSQVQILSPRSQKSPANRRVMPLREAC
jgi:hypothetical protein